MHYYQFRINDYATSTQHLDELEDLAYRRMLDLYYQKESPLPDDVKVIARLIRMRSHTERIEVVLEEFFTLLDDGYHNLSADKQLAEIYEKSEKARKSAEARWRKKNANASKKNANASKKNANASKSDANALRTECDSSANGMLPNNTLHSNQLNKDLCEDQKPLPSGRRRKKTTENKNQKALEVLNYLNSVCSTNFRPTTQSHLENINARLREGNTVDDCKAVIDFKFNDWFGTKNAQYLRPSTLFQSQKFPGYLLGSKSRNNPVQTRSDVSPSEAFRQELISEGRSVKF